MTLVCMMQADQTCIESDRRNVVLIDSGFTVSFATADNLLIVLLKYNTEVCC